MHFVREKILDRKEKPGAKARIFVGPCAARLKSCPDTKHRSRDSGKTRAFRRLEFIASTQEIEVRAKARSYLSLSHVNLWLIEGLVR